MSVKRYDIDVYSSFEAANWTLVESEVGDFVYASDYDELNAKYKRALFVLEYERENRMIERDAANELRERVAWMLECGKFGRWLLSAESGSVFADALEESFASYAAARKSVEELL